MIVLGEGGIGCKPWLCAPADSHDRACDHRPVLVGPSPCTLQNTGLYREGHRPTSPAPRRLGSPSHAQHRRGQRNRTEENAEPGVSMNGSHATVQRRRFLGGNRPVPAALSSRQAPMRPTRTARGGGKGGEGSRDEEVSGTSLAPDSPRVLPNQTKARRNSHAIFLHDQPRVISPVTDCRREATLRCAGGRAGIPPAPPSPPSPRAANCHV